MAAYYYAQVDDDHRCFSVQETHMELNHPNLIPIESFDERYVGMVYEQGQWILKNDKK